MTWQSQFQKKSKKEPAKSNTQTGDLGKNWGNPDGLKLQKAVHAKVRDQSKKSKEVMKKPQQNKTRFGDHHTKIKGSPTSMKSKIR
jgi:hypothetical protein